MERGSRQHNFDPYVSTQELNGRLPEGILVALQHPLALSDVNLGLPLKWDSKNDSMSLGVGRCLLPPKISHRSPS